MLLLKAFKKTSSIFVCKMRNEKMEKIKNVLLQLSSNGNRMIVKSSDKGCKVKKASDCTYRVVIFRFVHLNSGTYAARHGVRLTREQWFSSFYFTTLLMTSM